MRHIDGVRNSNPSLQIDLLEVDDELAETIPVEERDHARRELTARGFILDPGDRSLVGYDPRDSIGLIVVDGFLTRDVLYCGTQSRELIGPGDLVRPWDRERDFLPPFAEPGFTVFERTTLARLDLHLLALGARWPAFVDELMHRAIDRARWLAVRLAINNSIRVDERLLLFLWHNAGRWGRVTRDGILLPLSFTHGVLAELVGAQRATITTALGQLRKRGEINYTGGKGGQRRMLLTGDPPQPASGSAGRGRLSGATHRTEPVTALGE